MVIDRLEVRRQFTSQIYPYEHTSPNLPSLRARLEHCLLPEQIYNHAFDSLALFKDYEIGISQLRYENVDDRAAIGKSQEASDIVEFLWGSGKFAWAMPKITLALVQAHYKRHYGDEGHAHHAHARARPAGESQSCRGAL